MQSPYSPSRGRQGVPRFSAEETFASPALPTPLVPCRLLTEVQAKSILGAILRFRTKVHALFRDNPAVNPATTGQTNLPNSVCSKSESGPSNSRTREYPCAR